MTCIARLLAAAIGRRQIGERTDEGAPRYRDNVGAFRRYIQLRICLLAAEWKLESHSNVIFADAKSPVCLRTSPRWADPKDGRIMSMSEFSRCFSNVPFSAREASRLLRYSRVGARACVTIVYVFLSFALLLGIYRCYVRNNTLRIVFLSNEFFCFYETRDE